MSGPQPQEPGWYPDSQGNLRWFDGQNWTDHVQTPPDPDPMTAPLAQAGGDGSFGEWTGPIAPVAGGGSPEPTTVLSGQGCGTIPPPPPSAPGGSPPYSPYPPAAGSFPTGQQGADQLQVGQGRGLKIGLAVAAVIVLVVVAVSAALVLLGGDGDDVTPNKVRESSQGGNPSPDASSAPAENESTPNLEGGQETNPGDLPTLPVNPDLEDLFSDLPTELPSDLFSDFPSDLFEDFPTDPSEFESWFQEYLEKLGNL